MKPDPKILVAGAGGFVGGHLVRYLLEHGYNDIRAVDLKLRAPGEPVDISMVTSQVEALLDRSVATKGYIIRDAPDAGDKYRIDFEGETSRGRLRASEELLLAPTGPYVG